MYIYIYVYIYTYVYTYIYIHMYVCMLRIFSSRPSSILSEQFSSRSRLTLRHCALSLCLFIVQPREGTLRCVLLSPPPHFHFAIYRSRDSPFCGRLRYIHTCIHTHMYIYICIMYICICIYVCVYSYIHVLNVLTSALRAGACASGCVVVAY